MVFQEKLRRPGALASAALLLTATLLPLFINQTASAYALLGPRQVKMSTSQPSATAVSYRVKFRITSDATDLGGIVVAFCNTTPIINDTGCTVPTGFSLNGVTVSGQTTGAADEGDATADISTLTTTQIEDHDGTGDTDENTLTLSNGTAVTAASIDAGDYVAFTINGVVNPSTTGTFYARVYTYDTQAEAQGYTLANPAVVGAPIDAGGAALSTAAQITVTAKVQERLTFCVYTDGDGDYTPSSGELGDANTTSCSGVAGTSVTLGDTNGVLTDTGPYINKDHAMFNITTNASQGAIVRAKANSAHASGTLASGSFSIAAIGSGTTESIADDDGGTEEYGFCVYQSNGSGITVDADYDGDNGAGAADDCSTTSHTSGTGTPGGNGANNDSTFAFITSELTSTYGSPIATKTAGGISVGRLVFAGNISSTTEPAIYTSTMTLIATGNY